MSRNLKPLVLPRMATFYQFFPHAMAINTFLTLGESHDFNIEDFSKTVKFI